MLNLSTYNVRTGSCHPYFKVSLPPIYQNELTDFRVLSLLSNKVLITGLRESYDSPTDKKPDDHCFLVVTHIGEFQFGKNITVTLMYPDQLEPTWPS